MYPSPVHIPPDYVIGRSLPVHSFLGSLSRPQMRHRRPEDRQQATNDSKHKSFKVANMYSRVGKVRLEPYRLLSVAPKDTTMFTAAMSSKPTQYFVQQGDITCHRTCETLTKGAGMGNIHAARTYAYKHKRTKTTTDDTVTRLSHWAMAMPAWSRRKRESPQGAVINWVTFWDVRVLQKGERCEVDLSHARIAGRRNALQPAEVCLRIRCFVR